MISLSSKHEYSSSLSSSFSNLKTVEYSPSLPSSSSSPPALLLLLLLPDEVLLFPLDFEEEEEEVEEDEELFFEEQRLFSELSEVERCFLWRCLGLEGSREGSGREGEEGERQTEGEGREEEGEEKESFFFFFFFSCSEATLTGRLIETRAAASASLALAAASSDSGSLVRMEGSVTSISLTFVVLLFVLLSFSFFEPERLLAFLWWLFFLLFSASGLAGEGGASCEGNEGTTEGFSLIRTASFSRSLAIFWGF